MQLYYSIVQPSGKSLFLECLYTLRKMHLLVNEFPAQPKISVVAYFSEMSLYNYIILSSRRRAHGLVGTLLYYSLFELSQISGHSEKYSMQVLKSLQQDYPPMLYSTTTNRMVYFQIQYAQISETTGVRKGCMQQPYSESQFFFPRRILLYSNKIREGILYH